MKSLPNSITGVIEKLVFGGHGLLRDQSLVVFVPYTIPGEKVRCKIVQKKTSYALGKVDRIITPSQYRQIPKCPVFTQCGGCSLQEISYSYQLSCKKAILQEALRNVYKKDIEFVPSPDQYGYRRKITIRARRIEGQWECGYFSEKSQFFVPIRSCPLFSLDIDIHALLHPLLENLPHSEAKIALFQLENGLGATLYLSKKIAKNTLQTILEKAKTSGNFIFCTIKSPTSCVCFGSPVQQFQALGHFWSFSTEAFVQIHRFLSPLLWEDIVKIIVKTVPSGRILDLYAGIGITSTLLAEKGFFVETVEASKEACKSAKENCMAILRARNEITPLTLAERNPQQVDGRSQSNREVISLRTVRKDPLGKDHPIPQIFPSTVENFLEKYQKRPDAILLNPPRTGLSKKGLSQLLSLQSPNILYTSCCPPTLARDIMPFLSQGYAITYIKAYDLFPQTTHFETSLLLQKKSST